MLTKYIANKMIVRKLEEKRCLLVERYRFIEEKYIEKTEEFQLGDLYLLYKEILDLDEGLLVLYKKIEDFLKIWKDFGEQWVEDKKIDFQIDPAWEDFGKVTEYSRSREIDFQIDPSWEDFGKVIEEEQRVDEKKIDFQIDPAWEDFGKVIEEEEVKDVVFEYSS